MRLQVSPFLLLIELVVCFHIRVLVLFYHHKTRVEVLPYDLMKTSLVLSLLFALVSILSLALMLLVLKRYIDGKDALMM